MKKLRIILSIVFLFFSMGYSQIMINGVCWAACNLDVGGVFVVNPEDVGALYQWGRHTDGHENRASEILHGAVSVLDPNGQVPVGNEAYGKFVSTTTLPLDWRIPQNNTLWNSGTDGSPIKTINDPCPEGWRIPTLIEFQGLIASNSNWGNLNGINGRFFGNKEPFLFLPAAGIRQFNVGNPYHEGVSGYYWSSAPSSVGATHLFFISSQLSFGSDYRAYGFSVRCVKETLCFTLLAAFYINNVHYGELQDTTFCNKKVNFNAEIEGLHPDPGSLKWYIDGEEEIDARDQQTWSKQFASGNYEIIMEVRYVNEQTETITGILKMEVLWIKLKNIRY